MAAVSHNHEGYQARLDFIREKILAEHLGLSGEVGASFAPLRPWLACYSEAL